MQRRPLCRQLARAFEQRGLAVGQRPIDRGQRQLQLALERRDQALARLPLGGDRRAQPLVQRRQAVRGDLSRRQRIPKRAAIALRCRGDQSIPLLGPRRGQLSGAGDFGHVSRRRVVRPSERIEDRRSLRLVGRHPRITIRLGR